MRIKNNIEYIKSSEVCYWKNNIIFGIQIFQIIAFILLLFSSVLLIGTIPTPSMESTLSVGTKTIINKLDKKIDFKDIIVFDNPLQPSELYVKRVIGLPGDKIEFKDGEIYRNGSLINEPYVTSAMEFVEDKVYNVPKDSYFVLGDNRNNSIDSRYWDNPYVHIDTITGTVFLNYRLSLSNFIFKFIKPEKEIEDIINTEIDENGNENIVYG